MYSTISPTQAKKYFKKQDDRNMSKQFKCSDLYTQMHQAIFKPLRKSCYLLRCIRYKTRILTDVYVTIFTMVTYFLRWTLLKFFNSFPDEQSQQKVRQLDRITAQWLIHQMKLRARYCWNFESSHSLEALKYKEWVSFFLGSWGMNRSAEQTNRPRTASRFTWFICPVLRFIPHEPRKKTLIPSIVVITVLGLITCTKEQTLVTNDADDCFKKSSTSSSY